MICRPPQSFVIVKVTFFSQKIRNHEKAKHIEVRYHFFHEVITRGDIVVTKVSTQDNPANIMTNTLPVTKLSIAWTWFVLVAKFNPY